MKGIESPKKLFKPCLETLISHIPNYVFWKDRNSVYQGCNDLFAREAGLTHHKEIEGLTDSDLPWSETYSDEYLLEDQQVINEGKTIIDRQVDILDSEGQTKTILVTKLPLITTHDEIIGLIGIYTDITQRNIDKKALDSAIDQAKIANELKLAFIRNMQHDIRTPYTGIWGVAKYLVQQEPDPQKKELLEMIASSAKQLLNYCNSVLDYSFVTGGHKPVQNRKFDLCELLHSVISMEMPAAEVKNIQLNSVIDEQIPNSVIGDEYRIRRILINILGNAIKFTQEGSVSLSAKLHLKKNRHALLEIVVEDTGIGMSDADQRLIYQQFTRFAPANIEAFPGIGLGLTLVKQFIDDLDADLEVESTTDVGTKMQIYIPLKLPLTTDFRRLQIDPDSTEE